MGGTWLEGMVSVGTVYQCLALGCTLHYTSIDNILRLGMSPKCLHMLKVLKRENFSA